MSCLEFISDIIKIEAYGMKHVSLSVPFTHDRVMPLSAVSFSAAPVVLSLKQGTAEARCSLNASDAGDQFNNSLTWQADDNLTETLQQVSRLSSGRHHYIVTTYDGVRKLLYNWCGTGRTLPDNSISGNTETCALSFNVTSRYPILTLI